MSSVVFSASITQQVGKLLLTHYIILWNFFTRTQRRTRPLLNPRIFLLYRPPFPGSVREILGNGVGFRSFIDTDNIWIFALRKISIIPNARECSARFVPNRPIREDPAIPTDRSRIRGGARGARKGWRPTRIWRRHAPGKKAATGRGFIGFDLSNSTPVSRNNKPFFDRKKLPQALV